MAFATEFDSCSEGEPGLVSDGAIEAPADFAQSLRLARWDPGTV